MSGTYEYPAEVVLARAEEARKVQARIQAVRKVCEPHTVYNPNVEWGDCNWLAQAILRILDGQDEK